MKFITLLLSVALYCCGNAKEAANYQSNSEMKSMETLSGTYTITLLGSNKELPENTHLTFDDTTNKVSGFAGCNNFFGDYTVEGSSIQFGAFGMTKRMCKRFMDVEENMLNALSQSNTFSIENGALKLYNDKTDSLIEATKINADGIVQDDDYALEYIAETRGSYKMVSIKNNIVSYSTQRGSDPISRVCSDDEIKSISDKLNVIELEKLETLEAPSDGRHTDRAAIGKFKITHKGFTYKTPEFDDGNPNSYVADLIKAMTSMMEKH